MPISNNRHISSEITWNIRLYPKLLAFYLCGELVLLMVLTWVNVIWVLDSLGKFDSSFSPTEEKGGHEGNQRRPESDLQAQKWALLPVWCGSADKRDILWGQLWWWLLQWQPLSWGHCGERAWVWKDTFSISIYSLTWHLNPFIQNYITVKAWYNPSLQPSSWRLRTQQWLLKVQEYRATILKSATKTSFLTQPFGGHTVLLTL